MIDAAGRRGLSCSFRLILSVEFLQLQTVCKIHQSESENMQAYSTGTVLLISI